MEKIILLHTNDLHSHLENWPRIRRYLQQRQKEAVSRNESVVTVDLGDFVDRWHPLTEATNGQANILLMNQANYDAVTIGNNEGVGNSKSELNQLYNEAEFPVILDNLFDKKTLQPPSWSKQYKIITTAAQTKIGLLALTAPFPLTYAPNGWDIREPLEILPSLITNLRKQVDVLVLMSHLGVGTDYQIAENFPQLDVILGSHTHHLFPKGKTINGVQLAAAGKFGGHIGEVILQINEKKEVTSKKAHTIDVEDLTVFLEDQEEIAQYIDLGHQKLQKQVVAKIPHSLSMQHDSEHSLVKTALEAVKKRGKTSAAILNSGLFLTDLKKGIVTQDQLHSSLPHPMHLIRVSLKGSDMIRLIYEMEKNRHFLRNYAMRGMGFRGNVFGDIVYSGVSYDHTNHQVLWQEKPLNPQKTYTFTTIDHFLFIPFFPTIEIAGESEFLFPEFIRTVVGNYLTGRYPLVTESETSQFSDELLSD